MNKDTLKKKYANKIFSWRGGGYSGCIWEPNLGFTDDNAVYHPVISTGCGAIDDIPTLRDAIAEYLLVNSGKIEDGWNRKYDKFVMLPMTQESVDILQKTIRNDFVAIFVDAINDCFDVRESFKMCCTHCGKHFSSFDYSFSEIVSILSNAGYYRGNGGIGTITDDVFCDECKYELVDSVHEGDWVYVFGHTSESIRGKSWEVKSVSEDGRTYTVITGRDENGEDITEDVDEEYCEKTY